MEVRVQMETCLNYTDRTKAYFSSDERRFITKIRKLKEKYPEQVRIIREPEDNDGCIYARLPSRWLKIQPKIARELSDEERVALATRLACLRQKSADGMGKLGKDDDDEQID